MALKTNVTSITLTGTSTVETENGTATVMTMSATINERGHSSDNYSIVNQELYEENKVAVRADKAAFTKKMQDIEDAGVESLTE